jgi:hypothetical protein
MMRKAKTWHFWLRMMCVALLLSLGFSHAPYASAVEPTDVAAYTLPDGTVPVICYGADEDGTGKKMVDHGCEACRLSSSIAMPLPSESTGEIVRIELGRLAIVAPEQFHRLIFPPSAAPRAPPVAPAIA